MVLGKLGVPSLPLGSRGTRMISLEERSSPGRDALVVWEEEAGSPPMGNLLPILTPSVPLALIQIPCPHPPPPIPPGQSRGEGHQITPLKRRDINNPITPEQDKSALS